MQPQEQLLSQTAPAESGADMMSKGSTAVQLAVRAVDPADASTQSANVPRKAGACVPVSHLVYLQYLMIWLCSQS